MGVRIYFESYDQRNGTFYTPTPLYFDRDDGWVVNVENSWVHVSKYKESKIAPPERVSSYPARIIQSIDWVAEN